MNGANLPRLLKRRSKKANLPPGSIVFIGEKKIEAASLSIIDYDEKGFLEKKVQTIEECLPFKDLPTVTWFNVYGLHQTKVIEKMGQYFNLHPLLLEDIANTDQRPKMDDYGNYLFFVIKMLQFDESQDMIKSEQISFILGPNYVISFQEDDGDIFDSLRERIRNSKGVIRRMGADYLVYALMDTVVDNYFAILEKLGDKIEYLEDELVSICQVLATE